MRSVIHAADLFCGAGGTSTGLVHACRSIGRCVDLLAVNHWKIAIESHSANHPEARHICARLEAIRPEEAVPGGRVDILVASPECTHHSIARGGRPVSDQLRASAWLILRWLEALLVDGLLIENVREFRDWGPVGVNGRPIKSRKGETYQAFLNALRSFGYTAEDRILNAADYGDATTRQRLFILARKGRKSIHWPDPTHGEQGLMGERKPYRTAREIIDWSIKGESIFNRTKSLAPATMARIAVGLKKFGGRNAEPFLVMFYGTNKARSLDRPLTTVTASGQQMALCQPFVLGQQSCAAPRSVDDPLPTIATKGAISLIEPFLCEVNHGGDGDGSRSVDRPLGTVTTKNGYGLVEPFLMKYHGNHRGKNDGERRTHDINEPIPTLDTSNRFALVEPFIVPFFDERGGQAPRCHSVNDPLPAVTSHGAGALVEPFIAKHYGTGGTQSVDEPLDTITTRDRFGLVEVTGKYQIDIRFRMLQPHELAAAMSLDGYQLSGTKADQVKQIGNAVPARLAEALCRALLQGK